MPKSTSNPTTEKNSPQTQQNLQTGWPNDQPSEDDTIDLYELWITLWNKKWIVIGFTTVGAIVSVIYAMLQPPVFKAETLLLPPKAKDIQLPNIKEQ